MILRKRDSLVRRRQVPHRDSIGRREAAASFLDDRMYPACGYRSRISRAFRRAASIGSRECFWRLGDRHPVCQIAGGNEHVRPPVMVGSHLCHYANSI